MKEATLEDFILAAKITKEKAKQLSDWSPETKDMLKKYRSLTNLQILLLDRTIIDRNGNIRTKK